MTTKTTAALLVLLLITLSAGCIEDTSTEPYRSNTYNPDDYLKPPVESALTPTPYHRPTIVETPEKPQYNIIYAYTTVNMDVYDNSGNELGVVTMDVKETVAYSIYNWEITADIECLIGVMGIEYNFVRTTSELLSYTDNICSYEGDFVIYMDDGMVVMSVLYDAERYYTTNPVYRVISSTVDTDIAAPPESTQNQQQESYYESYTCGSYENIQAPAHSIVTCGSGCDIDCGVDCDITCGSYNDIDCGDGCTITCGSYCNIAHGERCSITHGSGCNVYLAYPD